MKYFVVALALLGCSQRTKENMDNQDRHELTTLSGGGWELRAALGPPLALYEDRLVATVDRGVGRPGHPFAVPTGQLGLAVLDAETGALRWSRTGTPPVALADADGVVAYGRAGVVERYDWNGTRQWRASVHDDRSASAQRRGDGAAPLPLLAVRVGERVGIPAGDAIVLIDRIGSVSAREVCVGDANLVLQLASVDEGRMVAQCGRRSPYDNEEKHWDGPAYSGARPTLAELRDGPDVLIGLDANADVTWRHEVPQGLRGLPFVVANGTVVYVVPSGDAFHVTALDAGTGTLRWEHTYAASSGPPLATPQGILLDPLILDSTDGSVKSKLPDSPLRLTPWHLAGADALSASQRTILSLDLAAGTLTDAMPRPVWPLVDGPYGDAARIVFVFSDVDGAHIRVVPRR